MKKLLGILVLGLLWCNVGFAEILELDHGIKINIPKNYEYAQFDQEEFQRVNLQDYLSKKELEDLIEETHTLLGMTGTETTTLIGKKGFADGYASLFEHIIKKKRNPESWSGFSKIDNKCGRKKTEKSQLKCIVNVMNLDPMIQIDIANGTNEEIKELSADLQEIVKNPKDVKEINKSSEIVKNYFGSEYQNEMKLKLTHIDNKQWGFAITGEDNLMGMKAKRLGYAMIYNDHFFSIQAFCMSQTSCKKIKKTNIMILQPYLSPISTSKKIETTATSNSNLAEELKKLSDLYKEGVLTKEEFEKAKKKILSQ